MVRGGEGGSAKNVPGRQASKKWVKAYFAWGINEILFHLLDINWLSEHNNKLIISVNIIIAVSFFSIWRCTCTMFCEDVIKVYCTAVDGLIRGERWGEVLRGPCKFVNPGKVWQSVEKGYSLQLLLPMMVQCTIYYNFVGSRIIMLLLWFHILGFVLCLL